MFTSTIKNKNEISINQDNSQIDYYPSQCTKLLNPEEQLSFINYQDRYENLIERSQYKSQDQENDPSLCNSQQKFYPQQLNSIKIFNDEELTQKKKNKLIRKDKIQTDRFVPLRRDNDQNFLLKENLNETSHHSDISSSQTALELLYRQQILKETWENKEEFQMKFKNANNFKYGFKNHYVDQINQENRSRQINLFIINTHLSPLVSSSYFEIQDTVAIYYSQYARKIPKVPYKVLDAPALQDDFYLNLIDWGVQNNLSVALGSCVYLWNAANSKVTKLKDLGQSLLVTSVAWNLEKNTLSVGASNGEVQIWDTEKLQLDRIFRGHTKRVGTQCFSKEYLSTGSRDKQILVADLRSRKEYQMKFKGHKQEVCGLKWSNDSQILASGGNDNKLFLWSSHSGDSPLAKFSDHSAAVKAIAWSPHQHGFLASGGGTQDKTIRFWNALECKPLNKIDTGSQICNLKFSLNQNELISTHGYSQNQIIIWKCNEMKRIATLTGHSCRVLYLAMSPDGETIVTGAGDETLRFWNINGLNEKKKLRQTKLVGNQIR